MRGVMRLTWGTDRVISCACLEKSPVWSETTTNRAELSQLWLYPMLVGMVIIAVLRIADTYQVFNHTMDEPAHIGGGMQYLDGGSYRYEYKHPPMRAVFAVGPWFLGQRYGDDPDSYSEGNRLLYGGSSYVRTLTAARAASLPFFAATAILIFLWARTLSGSLAGAFAVFAYTTLPLALAHAGLATNDTLVTATLLGALFAWSSVVAGHSRGRLVLFGIAAALAFLSKISAVPFIAAVVVVTALMWFLRGRQLAETAVAEPRWPYFRRAVAAALGVGTMCFVVIWAAYRFSAGPISDLVPIHAAIDESVPAGLWRTIVNHLADLPIPAPEFAAGVLQLLRHNSLGHEAFFMGSIGSHGHPAFFPVAVLIKTPIPFLLLCALGARDLVGRWWRSNDLRALVPPIGALCILAVCMASSMNVGLRHFLPAFPLLALCAGVGAANLWTRKDRFRSVARALLIMLLVWQALTGIRAHPDYLAYFNECCDAEPQRWLIDSDLDWGQDLDRLAVALKERQVDELYLAYFGSADPARHGLPPFKTLPRRQPVRGWVAISEWDYAFGTNDPPHDHYAWLAKHRPVARIGKTIRLYKLP